MSTDDVLDLGERCNDARLREAGRLLADRSFSVLSLDVFDTLVWRTTPEPVDAFVVFGRRLADDGVLRPHIPPELFARLRERAEQRARRRVPGPVPEVPLAAIHREMPGHLFSVPTSELPDLEVEFEKTITFPDLELVRLAGAAQAALGARLVLVSDTYYSGADIRRILDREPFESLKIDDVFTSSQFGTGKANGLYRMVLEALGVEPGEVLHIGDNPDSDVERPRREGIRTVLFDKHPAGLAPVLRREGLLREGSRQVTKPTLDEVDGDFGLTALRAKAVSRREGDDFAPADGYWRFGASVLGPAFTGFAEWVHERAREEGADTVYCVMREGEFLARLVNGARGYLRSPVRGETLWLSRQVCSRAAIYEASLGELTTFLDRLVPPTVGQLCETLGIELGQVPDLHADADTGLGDREVAAQLLRRITEQPHLRASIVARSAALRGRLVDYVLRTVRPRGGRAVLVDLGWGCTIQVNLDTALSRAGAPLDTIGLYMLTNEGALERILDGVDADGFLGVGGVPDHTSWITRSPEILEQVCMHDEGTLDDFTADAEPVLRPTPQRPSQVLQRAAVQRGILAFQREWGRYREALPSSPRALAGRARPQLTKTVTRFVVSPTEEEVALFAGWLHDQNFGSEGVDTVVRDDMVPALQYLTPRQLLELPMAKVYWPFGMAAMHNPVLGQAAGAILDGTLPAEVFEASQPCLVRVFVDLGGGFDEAVAKPAGPNVNGLSYVLADVGTRPIRGVMLRCSDEPGVLRLDRLVLSFQLRGRAHRHEVRVERSSDFSQVRLRNGVLLADNVVLAARDAPEILYRTPPEVAAAAYRVEVEATFAWMTTPRLRGRRAGKAEVAVQLARKVAGKARNVWLSSAQEADDRFLPYG